MLELSLNTRYMARWLCIYREFNAIKLLILSFPAWGEVARSAGGGGEGGVVRDTAIYNLNRWHQRPPAPSCLRGGVANALIDKR